MNNPFKVLFPENMGDETIQSLFVSEMTNLKDVKTENHHIVWGSRGAGKSMLFRYIWSQNPKSYSDLANPAAFDNRISICLQMSRGMMNVKEFDLLFEEKGQELEAMAISEHMLNMFVIQAIIVTLRKIEDFPLDLARSIAKQIVYSILDSRIWDTIKLVNAKKGELGNVDPFEWLHEITRQENFYATSYLKGLKRAVEYQGSLTGYYDFLYPVFKILKKSLGGKIRFFLLVDDAGYMHPYQQRIINGWLSHRDHDLLSVKISATHNDYICFSTPDNITLDPTHDFSETELDVVYYGHDEYEKRLEKILEKRFTTFGLTPVSPTQFFPEDAGQLALVEKCEQELKYKYEVYLKERKEKGKAGNPTEWATYKSRYLMPRVFQAISAKKGASYSYSGFKNLVKLSSGIVRIFIQMCSSMWTATQDAISPDPEQAREIVVTEIPAAIQNEAATEYAKTFLSKLPSIYNEGIETGQGFYYSNKKVGFDIVDKTESLLRSLGYYYRNRLLNPNLTEQLMLSFTIKDPGSLTDDIKMVLRIATMHSYLQLTTNSRKDSGIREDCYIMSRCRAPAYNLYPGALKGRVSYSAEDLKTAIKDPASFIQRKAPKSRNQKAKIKDILDGQTLLAFDDEIIMYDDDAHSED